MFCRNYLQFIEFNLNFVLLLCRFNTGDCYYEINDVTVGRISFCLHTFGKIIREHEMCLF